MERQERASAATVEVDADGFDDFGRKKANKSADKKAKEAAALARLNASYGGGSGVSVSGGGDGGGSGSGSGGGGGQSSSSASGERGGGLASASGAVEYDDWGRVKSSELKRKVKKKRGRGAPLHLR